MGVDGVGHASGNWDSNNRQEEKMYSANMEQAYDVQLVLNCSHCPTGAENLRMLLYLLVQAEAVSSKNI